jgi:ribosome biogenesis GTPase A
MKRSNAMNAQQLDEYIRSERKRLKKDFLQEADLIDVDSVYKWNRRFHNDSSSETIYKSFLKNDHDSSSETIYKFEESLESLRQKLLTHYQPSILSGPNGSFFYFYIQGKKFCILTPNNIYFNRRDKEMIMSLEKLAEKLNSKVAYYRLLTGKYNKYPDPLNLVQPTDRVIHFLAFLLGIEFISS